MARTHNELRRGPLGRALKSAIGDTDSESALERFGETLQATIDLWSQPEWLFLRDERLAAMLLVQAAVALEFGIIALVNPAGSNMLVVVEAAVMRGNEYGFGVATQAAVEATLAGTANGLNLDRRWTGTPRAVMRFGTDPAVVGQETEVRATGERALTPPIVLPPGQAATLRGTAVNTAVDGFFRWRERTALRELV